MGYSLVEPAAPGRLRRRGLQPDPRQGRAAGRARGDDRRLAGRARRARDRIHDGRRPRRLQQVVARPRGLLSARRRPAGDRRPTTVSPDASARVRAAGRRARRRLLAAPVSGNPKVVDAGLLTFVRLRAAHGVRARSRPYLDAARAGRDLRRRGRAARLVEDLPQPDARRRRPVAGRDHGARREGRDLARRLARVHQRQRRWARCSPATRRRRSSSSTTRRPSPRRCCARTSTSASRPRANSTCRCRSRRPPMSLSRR